MKTKKKPLKKQRLRNAEYYDFQKTQDELYSKSLKGMMFKHLMDFIVSEENIKLAYRNIKKNKGSRTAGVDKKDISYLAKWDMDKLIAHVRKKLEWYQPQAVKRVEIPKFNGKTRPLGIPTIMERLIQQCILQVLEPICEAKFHDNSYGFRPNRSQEHAIAQTCRYMQIHKLHYVVDVDIKGFFDNVNHGKLLKQLWTLGIRDKKLIKIISLMMKAEIAGIGFPEFGTPQGSILSPLLSNVVLNELDWWIASSWALMPTRHSYATTTCHNGTESQVAKYNALKKTKLKECFSVRYADDFKLFCRTKEDAEKLFIATKLWLQDRLGLEVSEEKSKIVNLRTSYSDFLGFRLRVHKKGKDGRKKAKFVVQSHISVKARKQINSKAKELIKAIKHTGDIEVAYKAIRKYNAYVLGIHNYYRLATDISCDMHKIAFQVKTNFNVKFKRALKKTTSNSLPDYISSRYGNSQQMRYLCGYPILPIGYIKHKNPMCKKKNVNQYTQEGRELIHKKLESVDLGMLLYIMRNPIKGRSVEYNDNRLSLYSAQKGKCRVTGKNLTVETIHCHHINFLKHGGNDDYSNLVLLDNTVHKLIHATKADTITNLKKELSLSNKELSKINKFRRQGNLVAVEVV